MKHRQPPHRPSLASSWKSSSCSALQTYITAQLVRHPFFHPSSPFHHLRLRRQCPSSFFSLFRRLSESKRQYKMFAKVLAVVLLGVSATNVLAQTTPPACAVTCGTSAAGDAGCSLYVLSSLLISMSHCRVPPKPHADHVMPTGMHSVHRNCIRSSSFRLSKFVFFHRSIYCTRHYQYLTIYL